MPGSAVQGAVRALHELAGPPRPVVQAMVTLDPELDRVGPQTEASPLRREERARVNLSLLGPAPGELPGTSP